MSNRRSTVRAAALAAMLFAMAALATPAAATAKSRTIQLSAITQRADINAGVSSKATLKLETVNGQRAGSASWSCAFVSPFSGNGTERCTDTYHLGRGTIAVTYSFDVNRSSGLGRHAITAGTAAFAHARGTVSVQIKSPVYRITIRLT
ncbi:MAG: hypothetical protein ACYCXW_15475 [Solirubrobacteraceae bacterium]